MNQNSPPTSADAPTPGEGRRSFLKRVAATTPILLTVAGRPAWATTCSISGMLSGNASQPGAEVQCQGLTPGYWRNHPEAWPTSFSPGTCKKRNHGGKCKKWRNDGTSFADGVFGDTDYDGKSMMRVLILGGNDDRYQLGAHAVAAVLNAARFSVQTFGYNVSEIQSMYALRYLSDPEGLKEDLQSLNERG